MKNTHPFRVTFTNGFVATYYYHMIDVEMVKGIVEEHFGKGSCSRVQYVGDFL